MDVLGSVKHPAAQTEPVQTPVGDFAWCTFFVFYINSCCLCSDLIAASRCYIKQQASYFIYISQPGRPASPLPGGWLIRGWCKFKRCHSGVLACLAHRIVYSPPTSCLSDTAGVLGEASRKRLWHRSSLQWEDKVKLDLLDSSSLHGQICVFIFAAFFSYSRSPALLSGFQGESLAFMKWPIVFHLYDGRGDLFAMIVQSRAVIFMEVKVAEDRGNTSLIGCV